MTKSTNRDHYFDNAKFILIVLVVVGHFIEPAIEVSKISKIIFTFIYLFHMPAFIFISGYFSKSKINMDWLFNVIKKFLIPYVIVQLIFICYTRLIGLNNYKYTLITPVYIYWYLFAMFIWSIAISLVTKIKIKLEYIIGISFIVGLLAGYMIEISWKLSLSRIIVFFPFYLLGYYYKNHNLNVKLTMKRKEIAIFIFISMLIIDVLYSNNLNNYWFYCADSYKDLKLYGEMGLLYRISLYLIQLLMTFSFFRFIPNQENKLTIIGRRTLIIYIAHGFLVKLLVSLKFYNTMNDKKVILLVVSGVITAYCFGKINIKSQSKSISNMN